MRERRAEMMTLYCERCTFGTELPLEATRDSCTFTCRHCNASLHWHVCPECSMGYVGGLSPRCALCSGDSDDDVELDLG